MREIKIWKMALIFFGAPIVVFVVATIVFELTGVNYESMFNDTILSGSIAFLSSLIFTLIAGRVSVSLIKERYIDFKAKVNIRELIGVTITQLVLSVGLSYVSIGVLAITNKEKALSSLNDTSLLPTNNTQLLLCLITIVILAPILEEIVFRKVLFVRLSRKLGLFTSAIISSILFGVGHDILGAVGAIIFGLICCILYMKYKNLIVPIAVHLLNNLTVGVFETISYFNGTSIDKTTDITKSDITMYLGLGSIITIIMLVVCGRFIVKNREYIRRKEKKLEGLEL